MNWRAALGEPPRPDAGWTFRAEPGQADGVDEDDRHQLFAQAAAIAGEALATARRERDRRRVAGADTSWLDQVVHELEPLAAQTRDIETVDALRIATAATVPGPCPADELAIIAGVTIADARRVLDQLRTAGLATRRDHSPPEAPGGE
jgi:hypothetical protein